MRNLIIVGARAHAREIHDAVLSINEVRPTWAFQGFVADGVVQTDLIAARGCSIATGLEYFDAFDPEHTDYVIGVGSPSGRKRIDEALTARGFAGAIVVHPQAFVGSMVTMGQGSYVAVGAVVTTQVVLGRHVHVNVHASVSHDCVIGDYSIINPGSHVARVVRFGEGVDVGVGASFRPNISVGSWSVVGAGAAVVSDIPSHVTVVGVPARELHRK